MVDGERRRQLGHRSECAERNLRAGLRAHEYVLQRAEPFLKLGLDLENHSILIELREHGRDLSLTERVAQCVVDQLWRDAQARRGDAVYVERCPQAFVLLIG